MFSYGLIYSHKLLKGNWPL